MEGLKLSDCMAKIDLSKQALINHIKAGNIKAEKVMGEHVEEWVVDEVSFNAFVESYNRKIIEKKMKEQADRERVKPPVLEIPKPEPAPAVKSEPSPVPNDTRKLDETEQKLNIEKEKYIELLQQRLKEKEDAHQTEIKYLKEQIEYQKSQTQQETDYFKSQVEEERSQKKDFAEKYHTSNERTLMLLAKVKTQQEQLEMLEQKTLEYTKKDDELNERLQNVVEASKNIIKETLAQGKVTILAVDDDPDFLSILTTNFSIDTDFALYTAQTVYQANAFLVKGVFDIILLDLRLQEDSLSGEEYYAQVKKMMSNLETTKLIIISGESEDRIQSASEQLNASATMKKPIKILELKEKIKALCKR